RRRRTRKSFGFPGFRVHFRVVDLTRTLGQPEGKTLEFKRDLSSPAGVMRAVVAFANTAGGTVIIGVDDGSRHVRGVSNPVELEERLSNMVSDTIRPRLVPDIEVLPWRRTHLVAVHVYPSPGRPYFLEREGVERGTYVRVGSTNRRADRDLIEELRRFSRGESFDEQAMPDLDSEAIDFRAASESFSELRKLKRSDLTTLNLVTTHQRRKVPTVGGILLFGVDRARHFPDAYIQAGRFAGTDKAKIADHIEIRSYPVVAIEEAIGFVQKHVLRAAEIGALRRKDRFTVPPVAVREAVVNAVVHADYAQRGAPIRISIFDDRLEVESPGLLPFGLTVEDLRQGVSKLRNRVVGRVFHELGLIEHWGSGIQRMTAACRDAGQPPPLLEEIGTRFRVTLSTARELAPVLDPIDAAILDSLNEDEGRSTQQIANAIKRTARTTRTRLQRLVDRGLVREVGSSPQDPRRRYYRAT
ncbi:MAG: putative DNA binding domain-containing protein, partial [Myxococcales bacterium]|nr:putative DNA binding domain-containing protein [Myxococcales bacterium]